MWWEHVGVRVGRFGAGRAAARADDGEDHLGGVREARAPEAPSPLLAVTEIPPRR